MESLTSGNPIGQAVMSFPGLSIAVAVLAIALFARFNSTRTPKPDLPVVGVPGSKITKKELLEGARKYPDTPFILPMEPPIVVLPIKIQDEVRNLPESVVSFTKEHQRNFFAQYTGIGDHRPEMIQAIRIDLTRHIVSTLPDLQDEVRYAFDKEFGECKDWTPFPLYFKVLRIVALLSGRIFVGRPLSREEEWIQASINYTVDCVKARNAIRDYPVWKRRWVTNSLPEIKKITQYRIRGGQMLEPIMKAQLAKDSVREKIYNAETGDEEGNFIEWLLKYTPEHLRNDPENLALNQMVCKCCVQLADSLVAHRIDYLPQVSFAAVHTSSMATTHAILDLVSRPKYIQILREEIAAVRATDGETIDDEGYVRLKKDSFNKLRKLDSFMKESQRFNPPIYSKFSDIQRTHGSTNVNSASGTRICTSDLALSTGHVLPKGTRICFPSYAVHTDPKTTTYSPEYNPPGYTHPEQFDGLRFYKLRNMPGKEQRHQFATAGPESLVFGWGNHTCPGRFFAANEIKIILVELLMNWDIRLMGDVEQKGGADKRPPNMEVDLVITPNPKAMVELKRRRRS
ncbi:cytochrome P450 [Canariomyces notabilis]|uniref:Cytochrome P450 n=1 Tax=Canariomyces notabilis TaxID=2074819 RepID=A0AAN6TD81_9PEZI|nr:cytochrome P450 [Canariomyces arenarius]